MKRYIDDQFEQRFSRQEPAAIPNHRPPGDPIRCPSFRQFICDEKPILFTSAFAIINYGLEQLLEGHEFIHFCFPHHDRSLLGDQPPRRLLIENELCFFKPGARPRAEELVFSYMAKDGYSAEFHRKIGWLYGYPDDEVEAFVQRRIADGTYRVEE